jgi:cation diffusion facilitator family transporter
MNLSETPRLKARLIAISLSVAVSSVLMALKFYAYWLTDSAAILSDALESIINVVASAFALGSIIFGARSPDPSHPYGHGKVEFFSAGFEGALIVFAACGIFYQAWPRIFQPHALPHLGGGLLILVGVNIANLMLGSGLVMVGRRTNSLVLIADGKHILTDVYTTGGVLLGLGLVLWTGWLWLDGAVACMVGLNIVVTGTRLVFQAAAGLMDASDPQLLEEISAILKQHRKSIWIDIHQLRARRSGDSVHVDFHLILPKDLPLEGGHREVKELEKIFQTHFGAAADILIHLDPCDTPICPICGFDPCTHRQADTRQMCLWETEVLTAKPGEGQE